jgi:hypothetical protein
MPDYSKGKIYTIRCRTDDTLIYVGSTINPLSKRWGQHKGNCNIKSKKNNLFIYETIRNNGIENWYIELYENYSCENKDELRKREGEVIRLIGNLNSKIAGRTKKEYADEHKEYFSEHRKIYREDHKEELSKKKKIYSEGHKEEISEQGKIYYQEKREEILGKVKIYREEHKEEILEKKRIYRQENKEATNEKAKIKYTCICGSTLTITHKLRHEKSIKHTKFININ